MKDPYWSLWGRLKSCDRRNNEYERRHNELSERWQEADGLEESCLREELERFERRVFRSYFPIRKLEFSYFENELHWTAPDGTNRCKAIKNDVHAVNTLRKLDL